MYHQREGSELGLSVEILSTFSLLPLLIVAGEGKKGLRISVFRELAKALGEGRTLQSGLLPVLGSGGGEGCRRV